MKDTSGHPQCRRSNLSGRTPVGPHPPQSPLPQSIGRTGSTVRQPLGEGGSELSVGDSPTSLVRGPAAPGTPRSVYFYATLLWDTLRPFGYAPFDVTQGRQDKLRSGQAPRAPRAFAGQRPRRRCLHNESSAGSLACAALNHTRVWKTPSSLTPDSSRQMTENPDPIPEYQPSGTRKGSHARALLFSRGA